MHCVTALAGDGGQIGAWLSTVRIPFGERIAEGEIIAGLLAGNARRVRDDVGESSAAGEGTPLLVGTRPLSENPLQ